MLRNKKPANLILLAAGVVVIFFLLGGVINGIDAVPAWVWPAAFLIVIVSLRISMRRKFEEDDQNN